MTPAWWAEEVALPLVAAAVTASVAPRLAHRVHPATATALLTVLAVGIAGGTAVGLGAVVVQAVLPLMDLRSRVAERAPGELASALLVLAPVVLGALLVAVPALRAVRDMWSVRNVRAGCTRLADGVLLLDSPGLEAYALAGPRRAVVISRGLFELLDEAERHVVVAHERAHLRRHHGAYVLLTHLAGHLNPLLRPLARGTRAQVERWADEEAAAVVGDRRTVARVVARTALASGQGGAHGLRLAAASGDPVARTRALMAPALPVRRTLLAIALVLAVLVNATTALAAHAVEDRFEQVESAASTV